jgi:hypothetical protein
MDKNQLEQYFIDQSLQNKFNSVIIYNLSVNPFISINTLIEIYTNCNVNFKDYIINNPNLTIDDVEQHLLSNTRNVIYTIGQYYDIFHDSRITFSNGDFYYKDCKLTNIVKNKHLTYEIFKSYKHINDISNNDYICKNPNGNIIHYDITNFDPSDFYYYRGIYDNNFEEFIIRNKTAFKINIDFMQRHLSYDFIQNNLDLFGFRHSVHFYCNKSLTINNILNTIENNILNTIENNILNTIENNVEIDHGLLFVNANITLDEITSNNLHNNEYFYYYALNRNCTVNDILTHNDLNWNYKKLNDLLSINLHDYNDNSEYIFKFAD